MYSKEDSQLRSPKVPKYAQMFQQKLRESQQKYSQQRQVQQPSYQFNKPTQFFFLRVRSIGVGAHSFVYLVQEQATNMLLAQKTITLQHGRQMKEQLLREIKIQLTCQHQNLVKLYHVYNTPTHIHMVMEYAEDALFQLKIKFKIFKEKQVLEVLRQVLRGLAYLHKHHIVHADVKLQNVMIANGVVKLCDFGYAHRIGTPQNAVVGTMEYLSPQYANGNDTNTLRDVWAVGIMAFQMLVGRNPFQDLKQSQKWAKLMKNQPQSYLKQLLQLQKQMGRQAPKVQEILSHIFVGHQQRWPAQKLLSFFNNTGAN